MNPHLGAVAALLHAAVPGLHVYVTEAERPDYDPSDWGATWDSTQKQAWTLPERYVVLQAPTPRKRALTITGVRSRISDYWTVTTAADSRWKFDWLASRVMDALDGAQPEVEDYAAHVELVANVINAVDKDVDPHMHYSADTYRYRATPA